MTLRIAILAFLACLTAACGQSEEREGGDSPESNPLLWEIARADGTPEGWLLGTVHALPDDARWRTQSIDTAIAQADVLAVEIADVGDGRAMANAFLPLAMSAGHPPLTARVAPGQRKRLAELVDETSYRLDDFTDIESWGAALILAQALRNDAEPENGVDRALIGDFSARKVVELEGARAQFKAFDTLSEKAQRAMLAAIVEDSRKDAAQRMEPIRLYLAGDAVGIEGLTRQGMLENPEIRSALLTKRNASWVGPIERMLEDEPRPLIAVGAAHMVGDDGLVALLEAEGYTVTRVTSAAR